MWSAWLVFCDCGFYYVCPLVDKNKRLMEAYGSPWGCKELEMIESLSLSAFSCQWLFSSKSQFWSSCRRRRAHVLLFHYLASSFLESSPIYLLRYRPWPHTEIFYLTKLLNFPIFKHSLACPLPQSYLLYWRLQNPSAWFKYFGLTLPFWFPLSLYHLALGQHLHANYLELLPPFSFLLRKK